jgi:hypothetical protein
MIAPWGLAFATLTSATNVHLFVGFVVAIAAGAKLRIDLNRPVSPAR